MHLSSRYTRHTKEVNCTTPPQVVVLSACAAMRMSAMSEALKKRQIERLQDGSSDPDAGEVRESKRYLSEQAAMLVQKLNLAESEQRAARLQRTSLAVRDIDRIGRGDDEVRGLTSEGSAKSALLMPHDAVGVTDPLALAEARIVGDKRLSPTKLSPPPSRRSGGQLTRPQSAPGGGGGGARFHGAHAASNAEGSLALIPAANHVQQRHARLGRRQRLKLDDGTDKDGVLEADDEAEDDHREEERRRRARGLVFPRQSNEGSIRVGGMRLQHTPSAVKGKELIVYPAPILPQPMPNPRPTSPTKGANLRKHVLEKQHRTATARDGEAASSMDIED